MKTLLTLDYEVFFGRNTGTVARTMIEPTEALVKVADRHGAKLAFFVDAGFILRLRSEMGKAPALRAEHDAVCRQVERLARAGHEIQLHIHPHWEDSRWEDGGWKIDVSRSALHAFEPDAIRDIVGRYAAALRELAGPRSAYAFRAGGWVIQPFHKLRPALREAGVTIDSTVYAVGAPPSLSISRRLPPRVAGASTPIPWWRTSTAASSRCRSPAGGCARTSSGASPA